MELQHPFSDRSSDLPSEQFANDLAAFMTNTVEVLKLLVDTNSELLGIVEGMSDELQALTAELATLKREQVGLAVPTQQVGRDADAERMLQDAAALAQRAATMLAHARTRYDDSPSRLRSVDA